ncbi:hypothetical protein ACKWRH_46195 (plasmid) [Bradyrhizobium sp. Pa8]|uniref:hypothetical protein n=1 Tax=Bradyrhizobium sp. Pa8 TaxID=3386552 RepID=UPI00403FA1EB
MRNWGRIGTNVQTMVHKPSMAVLRLSKRSNGSSVPSGGAVMLLQLTRNYPSTTLAVSSV